MHSCSQAYAIPGEYTVTITGIMQYFRFLNTTSAYAVTEVLSLGKMDWKSLRSSFYNTRYMTAFSAGNTDTSNVTAMRGSFLETQRLAFLDVSTFDTSSVTTMAAMFYNMFKLGGRLDLSNFDTSKVTNMSYMFYNMRKVSGSLDLSHFDTSKVTTMTKMFYVVEHVQGLDITGWVVTPQAATSTNVLQHFSRRVADSYIICDQPDGSFFGVVCQ